MALGQPVPLGEYLPDQPTYRGPGLITARNVLPREDGFYGPINDFSAYTAALPAQCRGAVSVRTATGASITFAGTASNLYKLDTDNTWNSVASGFSMAEDERWQWNMYGSSLIACGGITIAPQVFDLASGSAFADLSADAPNSRFGGIINDFMVFAGTYDVVNSSRLDQIWWSAKGDPASWPEVGTDDAVSVESSSRQVPDGGSMQGILGGVGGSDGALFGENRIWRIQYVGPRLIFQIDTVERNRGVYASGSLAQVGRNAYYLAEDGWFMFDGVQSTSIGSGKWDKAFLDDLDDSNKSNIWTVVDAANKRILCAYPGTGNVGGIANRIFAFNYATGRAAIVEMTTEILVALASQGYTLDSLDTLGYTMDTLPFSLDSRAWAGGGTFVGGANASHVLGQFNGATLQADLTTSEWSSPTHDRIFVAGVRVVGDGTNVQAALSYREEMGNDTPVTTTGYSSRDSRRICPQLVSTRYARTLLRVPAGEDWTSLQATQIDGQPDGDG